MTQDDRGAGRRKRSGRRRTNDTTTFDDIIRLRTNNRSLSVWAAITEVVRSAGWTHSEYADIHRVYRKFKRQLYDPMRAANAPLLAEELMQEGFVQDCQFFIDQDSDYWSDMSRKGYSVTEWMLDGRAKVQRHLRGILNYDELCAECAPYFASFAHLLDQNVIDDRMQDQANAPDDNAL